MRIYADGGPDNHLRLLGEALTEVAERVRRLALAPHQGGAAHHGRQGRQRRVGRTGLVAAQHGPGGLPGAVVGPDRDVTGENATMTKNETSCCAPARPELTASTPRTPDAGTCSTYRRPTAAATPRSAYLAGNSLGLQPRATRDELLADLDAWSRLGVEGHLEAERPWLPYHELLTGPGRATGRRPAQRRPW